MELLRRSYRNTAVPAVIVSAVVLWGSFALPLERAFAEASFADEIKEKYDRLSSHYTGQYNADQDQVAMEYEWLLDITSGEQQRLEQLVAEDEKYLTALFKADYEQLSSQFTSRDSQEKLRDYKREIDPHYSTGAMWNYSKEIDKHYSTSAHWDWANAINPQYSTSPMWSYKNTVNPNYSTSTMWKYSNTVNPEYSTSIMWALSNESNTAYSTSTMWKYSMGSLGQEEARTAMDRILTKGAEDLQKARDEAVSSVTGTHKETVDQLFKLRDETAAIIQNQRSKSVETILSIREQHFGAGLEVKPLAIPFDPIKVLIDGELMSFEQPPVIIDGNTLVPMRAIFERLGAGIEWDQTNYSVTAVKDGTTIHLKIGETEALLNGQTMMLEVPAQLVNSNTMVPVRFISESLGADVYWDGMTRTVVVEH